MKRTVRHYIHTSIGTVPNTLIRNTVNKIIRTAYNMWGEKDDFYAGMSLSKFKKLCRLNPSYIDGLLESLSWGIVFIKNHPYCHFLDDSYPDTEYDEGIYYLVGNNPSI